jgi:hypothetical protein
VDAKGAPFGLKVPLEGPSPEGRSLSPLSLITCEKYPLQQYYVRYGNGSIAGVPRPDELEAILGEFKGCFRLLIHDTEGDSPT